ncbi:MAG: hypothetical protein IJV15_10570 [Lachnospiraceae bacterium]|nr:hypothetical protein [Lachnospiraceae bacterium]
MIEKLEAVFDNIIGVFFNKTLDKAHKEIIRKGFMECGEFISTFENSGDETFGNRLLAVFSRDNLKSVFQGLKTVKGYDYTAFLRKKLSELCSDYDVDAGDFIEAFIDVLKKCIYENDKDLYHEIFLGENISDIQDSLSKIYTAIIDSRFLLGDNIESVSDSSPLNTSRIIPDDELEWNLSLHNVSGMWGDNDSRKNDISELTSHWKNERNGYPGWYIAPYNKRIILMMYTQNEELLFMTRGVAESILFLFAYEIVWRYETSFKCYSSRLIKKIRELWEYIYHNDNLKNDGNDEIKSKWFYIGQVLLREYREDMEDTQWNYIYKILNDFTDIDRLEREDLNLEYIKMLFMHQNISSIKNNLQYFNMSEIHYEVGLQIAGIKAECGMLKEAYDDLIILEKRINDNILSSVGNESNSVRLKSVLSGCLFLRSYVYQALNPFQKDEELEKMLDNIEEYSEYFSFDNEKKKIQLSLYENSKKVNKEIPFDLNKETKVIISSDDNYSVEYDYYRLIDALSYPLHIGYIRLLDDDESFYISGLVNNFYYIGWFMLLRFGSQMTIKKVVTRKTCISLINSKAGSELINNIINYIYRAVDENLHTISENKNTRAGNVYNHILSNGLELLKRLVSLANLSNQKKIIGLLCKMIDYDAVSEYRVINGWMNQVMRSLDDRVKSSMLNELLKCSAREKSDKIDKVIDPFDVFYGRKLANHYYEKTIIDPDVIDTILGRAEHNEDEKKHYVPRLGQLSEWKLLSSEQERRFGELLWSNLSDDGLPCYEDYYLFTYMDWPHPENINPKECIKNKIISEDNFISLKSISLNAFTFGDNRFLSELKNINYNIDDFWNEYEVNYLIRGLIDYRKNLSEQYEKLEEKHYFDDEYEARIKTVITTIASFGKRQIMMIEPELLSELSEMTKDAGEHGFGVIELEILCDFDIENDILHNDVINLLNSTDEQLVCSAVGASEVLINELHDSEISVELFYELMKLCRYRKEPGLKMFLTALHNCLYRKKFRLNDKLYQSLCEVLDIIDIYTNYNENLDKNESEIKNIITIREACANLAYQVYVYETDNDIEHSPAILNWKDICRGKKSLSEFC